MRASYLEAPESPAPVLTLSAAVLLPRRERVGVRGLAKRMPAAESLESRTVRLRFLAGWTLSALLAGAYGGEKPPAAQGIEIGFFGALTGPHADLVRFGNNRAQL